MNLQPGACRLVFHAIMTAMLAVAISAPASAHRAKLPTDWNLSPVPDGLYGGCKLGDSGLASKAYIVQFAGETLQDVLAITVLRCEPYGSFGPSGVKVVRCPAGPPFATCIATGNDGLGNAILFGVLKRGAATDVSSPACPGGQSKLDLLIRGLQDPRLISGIVTIACRRASGSGISKVACPEGPSPYAYCLQVANDGSGQAALLGVVAANGPDDPYGLYGECHGETRRGFAAKIQFVESAGVALDRVKSIEIVACNLRRGYGANFPSTIQKVPCEEFTGAGLAPRYTYCVAGTDSDRNSLIVGVSTHK